MRAHTEDRIRYVLVNRDNPVVLESVRGVIESLDGKESLNPEYSNEFIACFEYTGTLSAGIPCMAAGAFSVS